MPTRRVHSRRATCCCCWLAKSLGNRGNILSGKKFQKLARLVRWWTPHSLYKYECFASLGHTSITTAVMELCLDEKWKLSKRVSSSGGGSRRSSSSERAYLKRQSSMPMESQKGRTIPERSFTGRCAALAKEQRARFYIMRRCVTMLVCWKDYP